MGLFQAAQAEYSPAALLCNGSRPGLRNPMGKDFAYVIGRWQLVRDKEGGGNVSGVYSLVFRRTAIGWKIVLDHTN